MFSKILLAYDGSAGSKLAFEKAAAIAKETGVEFTSWNPSPHYCSPNLPPFLSPILYPLWDIWTTLY